MSSRLTMIAGTPSFVAPEQAQGEPLDAPRRPVLAGRAGLPAADRPAAVLPRLAVGRGRPGPPPPLSTPERPFPDARRGRRTPWPGAGPRRPLARRRGVRRGALGGARRDRRRVDVLAVAADGPDLTQPGARPSPLPLSETLPPPTPPRRRGRKALAAVVGAAVLLAGAGVGGYFYAARHRRHRPSPTRTGPCGHRAELMGRRRLARRMAAARRPTFDPVRPSVGDRGDWRRPRAGRLRRPSARRAAARVAAAAPRVRQPAVRPSPAQEGDPALTVDSTGCPGGDVTIERVVQVARTG